MLSNSFACYREMVHKKKSQVLLPLGICFVHRCTAQAWPGTQTSPPSWCFVQKMIVFQ